MATNMPTALDNFTATTPSTTQSAVPHSARHNNTEDAIKAIERVVVGPTYWNIKGNGGVGNGTANDSAAITANYNAAPAGAIMRWPQGRYMVDPDILNIISQRKVEGDGQYHTQLALRSNTANAAILLNITQPGPEAGVRGAYGPTIKGIGIDLGAAPSATGIKITANSGWAWLDDVRIEGGTYSLHNIGPNTKVTNCHFVNPSGAFMKLDNALELRVFDTIMTLTSGTLPVAILLTVTAGGTALYLTNVHCNNTGTLQKGLYATSSTDRSTPIRAVDVVFDNIAGPSWDFERIMDCTILGGWANSAAGGDVPAVRILGGGNLSFVQTSMNGGIGGGSGWASIEFMGESPHNCVFMANELNTGVYYRLTGASGGDPTNLFLMDRLSGSTIIDIGNLTNEFDRLQGAMTRLWTPQMMAVAPYVRESGTRPPAGYNVLGAGGIKVINHAGVKVNTRIRVTMERPGGTVGHLYSSVADNVVGTSFTVRSDNAADTSGFYWEMYDAV